MGRLKGSKNKLKDSDNKRPIISSQPIEERLKVLAHLIVDRMLEDQQNGILRLKTDK